MNNHSAARRVWNNSCRRAFVAGSALGLLGLAFHLSADTIYVSNYGDSTVTRIATDGQKRTYASGLRLPYGLAFDSQGNLLCASGQTNQVYSIDRNGTSRDICRSAGVQSG